MHGVPYSGHPDVTQEDSTIRTPLCVSDGDRKPFGAKAKSTSGHYHHHLVPQPSIVGQQQHIRPRGSGFVVRVGATFISSNHLPLCRRIGWSFVLSVPLLFSEPGVSLFGSVTTSRVRCFRRCSAVEPRNSYNANPSIPLRVTFACLVLLCRGFLRVRYSCKGDEERELKA